MAFRRSNATTTDRRIFATKMLEPPCGWWFGVLMTGATPAGRTLNGKQFDPFAGGAVYRWVRGDGSNPLMNYRAWILRMSPLLVWLTIAALLVVTGSSSAVYQPHLGRLLWNDAALFIGLGKPQPAERFSLLRDIPFSLSLVLVSQTAWTTYRQWLLIAKFIPNMEERSTFYFDPANEFYLMGQVDLVNSSLDRMRRSVSRVVATIISVVFLGWTIHENGLFAYTYRSESEGLSRTESSLDAMHAWWANYDQSHVGPFLYLIVALVAVYVITLQTEVGARFVVFFWKPSNRAKMLFTADYTNADGNYGWAHMADLLGQVIRGLTVHVLTLIVVVRTLQLAPVAGFVIPALILTVLAGPLFLFIPMRIVNSSVRKIAGGQIESLTGHHREKSAEPSLSSPEVAMLQDLNGQVAFIRESVPFSYRRMLRKTGVVWLTLGYLIPAVASIFAILGAVQTSK